MSGDSSGRRSEGRGRGRDPHRDRTRSRSRSRSPLSRRGAAPERREAPERPSLEEAEPSDSGDEMVDPASLEAETDHGLCRQIRHQYRALINSVQQNREDILNASDKLTEVLEEANTLFNGVSRAREAVLDAQFLVLASDLGKEKAKQLRSDLNSFDMLRYVETLVGFNTRRAPCAKATNRSSKKTSYDRRAESNACSVEKNGRISSRSNRKRSGKNLGIVANIFSRRP